MKRIGYFLSRAVFGASLVFFAHDSGECAQGEPPERRVRLEQDLKAVAASGPVAFTIGKKGEGASCFSADGRYLAGDAGTPEDGQIVVWDLTTKSEISRMKCSSFSALAFASKDELLAAACSDGKVLLFNYRQGHQVGDLIPRNLTRNARRLSTVPKHPSVLVSVGLYNMTVWDVATRKEKFADVFWSPALADRHHGLELSVSGDGSRAVVLLTQNHVRIVNLSNGKTDLKTQLTTSNSKPPHIGNVAFAPDGKAFATVERGSQLGMDGYVRIWSAEDGTELASAPLCKGGGVQVQFTPDGRYLLASGVDGPPPRHHAYLRAWDLSTGKNVAAFHPTESGGFLFTISPDGKWLLTPGNEKIRLYEMKKVLAGE